VLSAGSRVGPYHVTGTLGAGGMGEVHRARDTRLGRDVALKVLPDTLAEDRDRMARLEREAKLLAALNHPHIAAIYGLEEEGGTRALVMELVEGPTLSERLERGAIPVDEALDIARQTAEALEYAHEHGIVHRDLKPANIKVADDGTVKLLDFGLAKAQEGEAAPARGSAFAESPTLSHRATAAGVILGTAPYMAPEQARGKPVDRRADIWAFGVVLLEMLTGRPVFRGDTVTDILAAIVKSEPDFTALPPQTPPPVRALLRRCLEKDPRRRLRDIGEARIVLETPGAEPPPGTIAGAEPGSARPRPTWVVAGALGALAVAAGASFLAGRSSVGNPIADLRATRLTFQRGTIVGARFAPDGQNIIYSGAWDGRPLNVYTVRSDVRESRALGVEGAAVLSVSSGGELSVSLGRRFTIGFESTGTLARMPLGASAPREILENVQDADWSPDGNDLAVTRDVGGRRRLEYPVGTVLHETGGWLSRPRVSPDGSMVAFLDHPNRGDNQASVAVVSRDGKLRTVAPAGANGLVWSPSGEEILHADNGGLYATDLSGRTRVVYREMTFFELYDVSSDGRVLLGRTTSKREIVGRAPGASDERNLSWADWSFPVALSDDGGTVVFEEQNHITDGGYALYLRPTYGAPAVRLGEGRAFDLSSDGRRVLGIQGRGLDNQLVILPTGAGEVQRLGPLGLVPTAMAFLPDGERILVAGHDRGQGTRLWIRPLSGGEARPISPPAITAYFCRLLSADGREAFATAPDGRLTLYPVEGGEPRVVPGTSAEDIPIRWTDDGRAVYVQSETALPARVERVDVATGARETALELTPPDAAGVLVIGPIRLSRDARAYVYSYRRILVDLYVVEGLRL